MFPNCRSFSKSLHALPPQTHRLFVKYQFPRSVIVYPFEKHSIYTKKLAKHGDLLTHDKDKSAWRLMNMERLVEKNFTIMRDGDKMRDLIHAIEKTSRNIFPVLDKDNKFLGVVVLDDIRSMIFHPEYYDTYTVNDLMHKMSDSDRVYITDSMYDVVKKYRLSDKYNIVVTDNDNNYIGFLSRANVFSAYRNFVFELSDE
jgi:CIC family chloride channel protein